MEIILKRKDDEHIYDIQDIDHGSIYYCHKEYEEDRSPIAVRFFVLTLWYSYTFFDLDAGSDQ